MNVRGRQGWAGRVATALTAVLVGAVGSAMMAAPAVAQESQPGFPPGVDPADVAEDVAPAVDADVEIVSRSTVDGREVIEISIPPGVAGGRLEPEQVGIIVGGNYVTAEVTRPPGDELTVVLAMDVSGSTAGEVLETAVAAATEFVALVPDGTLVGALSFAEVTTPLVTPTESRLDVVAALSALAGEGSTALFDGVVGAAEMAGTSESGTKVIVVFSDGGDTSSVNALDAAVAAVASAGAQVEVVALDSADKDPLALQALAAGGQVRTVDDPAALSSVFTEIGDRLGNRFIVTFDAAPDGFHVVVDGDHGLRRTYVEPLIPEPGLARVDVVEQQPVTRVLGTTTVTPSIGPPPTTPFGSRALTYGLGAVAVGVFLAAMAIAWPHKNQRRPGRPALTKRQRRSPKEMAKRVADIADTRFTNDGRSGAVATMLEQSGSTLRPGEWAVAVAGVATAAMAGASLVVGPSMGLAAALLVVVGARLLLQQKVKSVRAAFADQLGSTLQLMASNLRVGHGMLQSIDAVGRESEQPTANEFRRVTGEVRLGRDVSEALRAMADRLDNDDFRWVVQAIEIHREVGGDLGEVLDNVGETIRDRNRLKGQIHALSADGRISAAVMMALPFCVAGLMLATTPEYLGELTGRGAGRMLLAFGGVLMGVGAAWLKSIIKLEF